MSLQENVETVKRFFAAMGRGDREGLLSLTAEDIEWLIPGEDWPLAGAHRGHAGLANLLRTASNAVETSYPEPPEFVAQGDRVLVVGVATGKIKATNKTFEDNFVFANPWRLDEADNPRDQGLVVPVGAGEPRVRKASLQFAHQLVRIVSAQEPGPGAAVPLRGTWRAGVLEPAPRNNTRKPMGSHAQRAAHEAAGRCVAGILCL